MRITNTMLTNQYLTGYNQSLSRVSDIQAKISTSKDINKPSDDPVRIARGLQYSSADNTNGLFTQNANDAVSWMKTSDSAVTSIQNTLSSIKTLISSAISPNPNASYSAIATQVDKAIDELVALGNAQIGSRYIFGGQNDTTPPFTRVGNTVTYNGTYDGLGGNPDAGKISMAISPGAANPARDQVNVDGQALFGTISATGEPSIFTDLFKIKTDIQNGSAAGGAAVLTNDLGTMDTDMDHVILAQTSLGARQAAYQTIQDRLTADSITIASDRSDNEDLDVAKASINLQTATNVYNMVLGVGAKVLPKSLLDYLG